MAVVTKTVFVTEGGWRTLESLFNTSAMGAFRDPAGAQIRIRYGVGSFGFDREKQTPNGDTDQRLDVGKGGSLARARMQMDFDHDAEVTYTLILPGP